MRIIGGARRGKLLFTPSNLSIRPTADRVRESIFNILADQILDANVLDMFAGTGAMGLEALSRGAQHAVFIDNQPAALALIKKNIQACRWNDRADIIRWDLRQNLKCIRSPKRPFTLVFVDPPYRSQSIPAVLRHLDNSRALGIETKVIIEHAPGDFPETWPDIYDLEDRRKYGKTLVSFFRIML